MICYIHQNPVKHGFVEEASDWPFSSFESFLSSKPTKLERQAVLDWFGGAKEFVSFHRDHVTSLVEDWEY